MAQKERADHKKHHTLYKTTCTVTGRYYIGIHSTDDLNDGYLGSGKVLGYSVKKHGKEAHDRELLEMFADRQSALVREAEVVDAELVKDPLCMNIIKGGGGYIEVSDEARDKMSSTRKGRIPWNKGKTGIYTAEQRAKMGAEKGATPWNKGLTGEAAASEATRDRMSDAAAGRKPWNDGLKGKDAYTPQARQNISDGRLGIPAWNKGRPGCFTDETRAKMSAAHRRVEASAAVQTPVEK